MRRVVLAAGMATASAALLPGILPAAPDSQVDRAGTVRAVSVGVLQPETVREVLGLSGRIVPDKIVTVHAPMAGGRVDAVLTEPGAEIAAGALLARLDATAEAHGLARAEAQRDAAKARLDAARIRLDLARTDLVAAAAELDRLSILKARGTVADTRLGTARVDRDRARDLVTLAESDVGAFAADLDSAMADVEIAREALAATEIRSPVAGRVLSVTPLPGDRLVGGAGPLFEIAQGGRMAAELTVLPQDLTRLAPGQSVMIHLTEPRRTLQARVGTVPFGQTAGVGPSRLRVSLPDAPGLHPGLPAKAEVELAQRLALRVPLGALRMTSDGSSLLGLQDGRAAEIPVTASIHPESGLAEILDGATAGTRIVLRAASIVTPGEMIRPVPAPVGVER